MIGRWAGRNAAVAVSVEEFPTDFVGVFVRAEDELELLLVLTAGGLATVALVGDGVF